MRCVAVPCRAVPWTHHAALCQQNAAMYHIVPQTLDAFTRRKTMYGTARHGTANASPRNASGVNVF